MSEALAITEENELYRLPVIVVSGENWHLGVIGIVASRLCEKYGKPTVVFSQQGDISFGSGRSIEGFSLYESISNCSYLFEKFGGHDQAAVITIKTENIDTFRKAVNDYAYSLSGAFPKIKLDCKLNPMALSTDLVESLSVLEPYGHANTVPLFGIFGVCVERITPIGNNKHIRLLLSKGETTFQAVRFSVSEEEFEYNIGDVIDIAVTLDINLYNGKEYLSIVIKDMRVSGTDAKKNLESLMLLDKFFVGKADDYSSLRPTREEFACVYKFLLKKKCRKETVIYRFAPGIYAGKTEVIITALKELDLVTESKENGLKILSVNEAHSKVDLNDAPIIKKLEA